MSNEKLRFKVGDRVVASEMIDEDGDVLPREPGVIESIRNSRAYPYKVNWKSGVHSSMIADWEIEQDLTDYVAKELLIRVFDEYFGEGWREYTSLATELERAGIDLTPPAPKVKTWRVYYELKAVEEPKAGVEFALPYGSENVRIEEVPS